MNFAPFETAKVFGQKNLQRQMALNMERLPRAATQQAAS